jgi:hypothetical protein
MQWRKPSALHSLRCLAVLPAAVKKMGVTNFSEGWRSQISLSHINIGLACFC